MPHSRSLLRVARQIASDNAAAEDLVQDSLLRAWRSFEQFQRGTNARAWLFRILFNSFYSDGRKIRSRPLLISLDDPAAEFHGEIEAATRSEDAADVMRALGGLSEEHKTVLLLGVVEGFTCRELAEILAIPIGTVMSRLSRARQALREALGIASSLNEPRHAAAAAGAGREIRELR